MAQLQIRLPDELKKRFERVCKKRALNRSALVRGWIEEFVVREERCIAKEEMAPEGSNEKGAMR